jgi:amino acid adenylation domain-containing protein
MNDSLFPLSFAQRMFWFLDRIDPDTPAYNLPRALKIEGQLDREALRNAFQALLHRHDVLRTVFVTRNGELFQRVLDHVEVDFAVLDQSGLPAPQRMTETMKIASDEARKSFDLEHGPLMRLCLFCLAPEEHVLVLVMHHIITDGWSMSILFKELAQFYAQFSNGREAKLAALPLQYTDFAHWQLDNLSEETLRSDVEYWQENLNGSPDFLEIPSDHPRPPIQTHRGSTESFIIDDAVTHQINDLCSREGVTLFMALLAIFLVLLSRYTEKDDILVGTPTAGRSDPDLAGIIGCFVNTLVIRGDLSGNPNFSEVLERVRVTALEAYTHQKLPFGQVLAKLTRERPRSHTPLFQTMFVLQNAPKQVIRLPGLLIEELELDSGLAKFDLTLEIAEKGGSLYCQIEYSTDLFERSTIERMALHFQTLILSAVEDPACPITKLNMLGVAERKQLTVDWNATSAVYGRDITIIRAFEDQVRRTPNAISLFEGVRKITFFELNRRANQVANELIHRAVQPGTPVGVYAKRSIDTIIALLAALKVGSPYVPLDTSQPKHRLHLMLKASNCAIVLTHRALQSDLPDPMNCVLLDEDAALWANQPVISPSFSSNGDVAYIIFTSGSTGVPKGVAGTHQATMNRLEWMYRTYPFSEGEVCCQKTALGFVDSIWEIFGPLLRGIPNVLIPEELVIEPDLLLELLERHRVTRIVLVPALLNALLEYAPDLGDRVPALKLWTVSGEYLPIDLVRKFRLAAPDAVLLNLYGSSEVAGDATYYEVEQLAAGQHAIPIGKPISNTQAFILDRFRQPVPIGIPGTLYIGGDCLSRGYWNQEDLTRERFVRNPFNANLGLLFDTGDRGRWRADGNIEYLGRLDTQSKIRGYRIELGEIEANTRAHPSVRQAVVVVAGSNQYSQQLVTYLVWRDGRAVPFAELQAFLRERLPEYMVPARFIEISEIPSLPNGKVDRHALPEPTLWENAARSERTEPRNDIERQLVAIWRELLPAKEFGVTDDFFALGGDSLLAMQVLARVRKVFQVELSIRSLFDEPTVDALGRGVEKAKESGVAPLPAIVPRPRPATGIDAISAELLKLSPQQIKVLLEQLQQGKGAP